MVKLLKNLKLTVYSGLDSTLSVSRFLHQTICGLGSHSETGNFCAMLIEGRKLRVHFQNVQ